MGFPKARLLSAPVVLVLVAGVLVSGAIVAGAHGGGTSRRVIHACVNDNTGAVEIVNANASCGANGSPLDWNVRGPEGNRGPAGPTGPPGAGFEDIVVVTATSLITTGAAVPNSPVGPGVGVDCPGDMVATGGGGLTPTNSNTLVASVPLEGNTTSNFADPGDIPTGWWAAGSFPVTVFALCTDLDPTQPDDDR